MRTVTKDQMTLELAKLMFGSQLARMKARNNLRRKGFTDRMISQLDRKGELKTGISGNHFFDLSSKISDSPPGDYYKKDGTYLGSDGKNDNKVYLAESKKQIVNQNGKTINKFKNTRELSITLSNFRKQAATVYGESSVAYGIVSKKEMFAIAMVHQRNKIAYGANSRAAKAFIKTKPGNHSEAMKMASAAVINVLTDGFDYSFGADQWDGAEQAMVPKKNMGLASNGRFMYKMNVMGWKINDAHYNSWSSVINKKFGEDKFTVPQKKKALHNYGGMKNKGKIRLNSTAQYGLTIFWKTSP